MIQFHKHISPWLFTAGLFLFFGSAGYITTITGGLLFGLSLILIVQDPVLFYYLRFRAEKHSSSLLLSWILFILAAILWFVRESILIPADNPSQLLVRTRLVLLILFTLTAAVSVMNRIFAALSEHQTVTAPAGVSELRLKTLLSVTLAVVIFTLVNYITYIRNPVLDLTFRNYTVSESARTLLKSVNKKTIIYAFIPVQQAVKSRERGYTPPELYRISEDIRVYLEQIALMNPLVKLEFRNAETETEGEFRGVSNGTVIVRSFSENTTFDGKPFAERRIFIQSERDLDSMERDLVRAVIQTSSPRKTAYFPSLNDERYFISDRTVKNEGIEILKEAFRFHNFDVRSLGVSEGWPGTIPDDADLLVIAGPKIRYAPESVSAIRSYIERGGRIIAAADPEGKEDLEWLLKMYDARYSIKKSSVTNVKNYTGLVISTDTASHRITDNLSLTGAASVPVVFPAAAYFEYVPSQAAKADEEPVIKAEVTPVLFSPAGTFEDTNKNKVKDANEKNVRVQLVLAVSRLPEDEKSGKTPAAVLASDIGWLTDSVQNFPIEKKNLHLALESALWLTENPLAAGLTADTRESRRIQVSEDLKLRNLILGIILFPGGTVLILLAVTYLYRKKRIWRESED